MKKLFYKDKVIIFNSNFKDYSIKDVIFSNKPTINTLIDEIERREFVVIVSNSSKKAFKHFKKSFQYIKAAGGIVTNSDGDTLMIYRNDRWDLPKGKKEKNERKKSCAIREVQEETGIDNISISGKKYKTLHIYNTYGKWELKKTFWYPMKHSGTTETFTPQTEEGITECKWVKPEELEEYIKGSYSTIIDVMTNIKK